MQNDIKIGINISDGGSGEKVNKVAKEIHGNLKDAADAAARIPAALAAAKEGVAAVNAMRSPARATRAPSSGTKGEGQEYAVSRGVTESTGAASRDFAKQAQGLGGLVHVYATFAANLFAVSAAFNALSKAADTTNMVKGLDQLSVSSGRALGSLSKQLSAVTDGAISMRDAMTATTQASAGGMTNAAILRMGNVAKQASQALGVAMPDALNRISRGITKLEPELLDEIGIMVRVDKTSQDYARTLGKTANSLTDFEKRQGFANAVLEQGEKKFGNIKIDANPYAKILASMENIAQTGLELVNKVLGPILTILSSSPTALATAMGAVAAVLLKQALPAIGSFKESLQAAADQAKILAVTRAAEARKGYEQQYSAAKEAALNEAKIARTTAIASAKETAKLAIQAADQKAQDAVSAVENAEARIKAVREKNIVGKATKTIISKEYFTEEDAAKLELTASNLEKKVTKGNVKLKESAAIHREAADSIRLHLDEETNYITASDAARKASSEAIKKATLEEEQINARYATSAEAAAKAQIANQKGLTTAKQNQVIAERALTASLQQSINAQAAQTAASKGFSAAWVEGRAAIKKAQKEVTITEMDLGAKDDKGAPKLESVTTPALTKMQGGWASLKLGIVAATGAIGTAMNFMGPWIALIGIAVAAMSAFSDWMSTGSKEIEKFNSSLDATKDSTKLLKDVSKDLFSKDSKEWLTAESMQARSTAIAGTSDSIKDMLKNLKEARIASNWWDNLFDGVFSKSRIQKTALAITEGIKEAVALARPSEAKTIFEQRVSEITGAKSVESVQPTKLTEENLKALSTAYALFSNDVAKNSEQLSAPKKAFEALGNAMQAISTAMMPTDNLSKFGMALMDVGSSLQAASTDTHNYFEELVRVSQDASKLSLLPDKRGVELANQSKDLQDLSASYNSVSQAMEGMIARQKDIATLNTAAGKPGSLPIATGMIDPFTGKTKVSSNTVNSTAQNLKQESVNIAATIASTKPVLDDLSKRIADKSKEFADLAGSSLREGALQFNKSLAITVEQGALKIASAVAGSITGLGSAEAKAQVAQKDISLRARSNDIMVQLIEENQKNTLAIINNTTMSELQLTEQKLSVLKQSNLASDKSEILSLEAKKKNLEATQSSVKLAISWVTAPKTDLMKKVSTATTPEETGAAAMVKGTAQQLAKAKADKSVLGSEAEVVEFNKKLGIVAETYASINRTQQNKIALLETEQKNTSQLASMSNSMQLQNIANTEAENIEREKGKLLLNAMNQLESEHAIKLSKAGGLTQFELKSYNDQVAALKEKTAEQTASNAAAKLGRDIADITKAATIETYKVEGLRLQQDLSFAGNTAKVDNAKAELESLRSIGTINDVIYAQEKAKLDIKSLDLASTKEQASIENTRVAALAAANTTNLTQLALIAQAGGTEAELADKRKIVADQLVEAQNRANAAADSGLTIARIKLATDTDISKQQAEHNILLAEQKDQMDKMESITQSLGTAFGDLGSKIGAAGKAILKMSQTDALYAKKKIEAEKATAAARDDAKFDPKGYEKAKKAEIKLEREKQIAELDGIANIAGATKDMFAEKTAAHKAFAAIEKVTAAVSMALKVQDMAMTLTTIGPKIASGVASLFQQGGWAGFAGAAAFLAIMSSLGTGGTASVSEPAAGTTAKDLQETQGTGQKWVDGKKVDTGGGVFGDSEAKSQSIQNSLDLIAATEVEGLSYLDEQVYLLTKIKDGIGAVATATYTIQGIRTGSGFGTTESNTVSPGLLNLWGSSEDVSILNSGLKFKGTLDQLSKAGEGIVQIFETVQTTSTDSFLFWSDTDVSLSENLKNLSEVDQKAAIAVTDTFKNIRELTEFQGNKLGLSSTEISNKIKGIGIDITASLRDLKGSESKEELQAIFSSILDDAALALAPQLKKFRQFGEGMYETTTRVIDNNNKFKLSLESIGITLQQIPEDIATVSQALIDNVTIAQAKVDALKLDTRTVVLSGYSGGESGENFSSQVQDPQVALDLAKATRDLNSAQTALTAATGLSTTRNFDLSEQLIKNAGGIAKYLEKERFFLTNFLTETQRLEPITAGVTDKINYIRNVDTYSQDLFRTISDGGNSIVNTREEFSALYLANKKVAVGTSENALAAQTLLTKLDDLAPNFLEVAEAAEAAAEKTADLENELLVAQGKKSEALFLTRQRELKAMTATDAALKVRIWRLQDEKEIISAANSQQIAILNLLGKSEEALAITRTSELENLEAQLRPRQEYLYALQDENTIREKLKSSLKTNSDSLKGFIKTLDDAKNSLKLGASSTLTPEQKYVEAKAQKDILARAATATAVTDSEIAARNEALSKLPSATATFLDASRGLFASSEQYTQDFNSVLQLLEDTSNNLVEQQTAADKQLAELTTVNTTLKDIKDLTADLKLAAETTASKLASYVASGTGGAGTSTPVTPAVAGNYQMPAAAPVSTSAAVESLYTSILKRPSDEGGKGYYLNKVSSGDMSISDVESDIASSPEAKIQLLYKKLANRDGEPGGVGYWLNRLNAGESKSSIIKSFAEGVVAKEAATATELAKRLASATSTAELVIPGFAKGGLASGVAVVGERGPELVDFATPSRVYSNKASNDLLNNRELIAEIKNLRKEVAELRADQREQTGHLIASNYDANNIGADKVVEATEEAGTTSAWAQRNKFKLA